MTDLHQARRFLRLLDPEAAEFTFQTFGEGRSKDAAELRCIRHGSFDKLGRRASGAQQQRNRHLRHGQRD